MHPILVGVELVSTRVHMQTLIRVEMNSPYGVVRLFGPGQAIGGPVLITANTLLVAIEEVAEELVGEAGVIVDLLVEVEVDVHHLLD